MSDEIRHNIKVHLYKNKLDHVKADSLIAPLEPGEYRQEVTTQYSSNKRQTLKESHTECTMKRRGSSACFAQSLRALRAL